MRIGAQSLLIGQPFVLLVAVLLDRWVTESTTLDVLARPFLALALATCVILLLVRLLSRSWTWAALLADAAVLFTLRELWPAILIAVVAVAWPAFRLLLRATRRSASAPPIPELLARAGSTFAVVLLVLALVSTGSALAQARPDMNLPLYPLGAANVDDPNIYLILLDAYPRADTLANVFGIDNSQFMDDLEQRGFDVSREARTNYNKTWLTLASMLNGAYIEELLGDQPTPDHPTAELRWLHALVQESTIPGALSERGYVVRTIASAYTSTALTTADDYVDHGQLNSFEVRLLSTSPWANVLGDFVGNLLVHQQAAKVRATLQTAAAMADDPGPQFVLGHVHSPHTPFVLGQPDGAAPVLRCFPSLCSFWEVRLERLGLTPNEYAAALELQLEQLNRLTLATLDEIVARDPSAVVIVFSDHGLRYEVDDTTEHFRSFLAARTPGHPRMYAEDESPVNLLRGILDAYLGIDLEPLPYRAWTLDWTYNLRLQPLPSDGDGGSSGQVQDPIIAPPGRHLQTKVG